MYRIIVAVLKGHYYKQIKVGNERWLTWTLDSFVNNLELYNSAEEPLNVNIAQLL